MIELRDVAHDLTNNLLTGFPPVRLRQAAESVTHADGLIAVTPIFNASYSSLFKSFFDVLDEGSLEGKPVLIAATGGSARHSLALEFAMRPMFAYLRSAVVRTAVFAASQDWGGTGDEGGLARRIDRAAGELADAMTSRAASGSTDAFAEPTPFAQLLAGG